MDLETAEFYYCKCRTEIPEMKEAEEMFSKIVKVLEENPDWAGEKSFRELVRIIESIA